MLYPKSFEDTLTHFTAIQKCCEIPLYESFETYLPENKAMRKSCIQAMRENEKILHYNSPGILHLEGPYYPCSNDKEIRDRALDYTKMHIEFAAEAESPMFVATACKDQGEKCRPELMKRYTEYFLEAADYCKQFHMEIILEPIERHRFKQLLLGPTSECARFILQMKQAGADSAGLMLDLAHLPLMEETLEIALHAAETVGIRHIHMGNAVLNPVHPYYGHMHAPIGIQNGEFDVPELTSQFEKLIQFGYITDKPQKQRATVSLEVRPYPGGSEETSIMLMYEKMKYAFDQAVKNIHNI